MKLLRILVSILMLLMLSHCRPTEEENASTIKDASDSIRPLALRNERQSFCGVDLWKVKRHRLCGVESWNAARTNACGAERFKSRAHSSCPGSVTEDTYENRESESCSTAAEPQPCRAGYQESGFRIKKEVCGNRHFDQEYVVEKVRVCHRSRIVNTCRKQAFGVEKWRSCRHSNHGAERYKSCRKEEFGVERYKQCSFLLTPEETAQYARQTRELIPFMGETLVTARGHYFAYANDESSMGCHIAKFSQDPLFDQMTGELKTMYLTKFGRSWDATRFDCGNEAAPIIGDASCPESDESNKCRAARSYQGAKKWLTTKATDLTKLINDIGARRDSSLKTELQKLHQAVNTYEN